jgi:hypothetical protein
MFDPYQGELFAAFDHFRHPIYRSWLEVIKEEGSLALSKLAQNQK